MSSFRSSNPALRADAFTGWRNTPGMSLDQTKIGVATVQGTISAALILASTCTACALLTASTIYSHPKEKMLVASIACPITLIMGLILMFKPMWARFLAVPFAIIKGVTVGVISIYATEAMKGTKVGGATGTGVVFLALGATLAVMLSMLGLYKAGILRNSPTLTRVLAVGGISILLLSLGSFVAAMFGADTSVIWGSGPLAIGITIAMIIYGALCFIWDFDTIEEYVAQGAPKAMEWYGAYALLATLVFLYINFIRLIIQIAGRRD